MERLLSGMATALLALAVACLPPEQGDDASAYRDYDGDGFQEDQDCDETSPYVYPGAEEIPYDGIDQDCSGGDYADLDEDGHDADFAGGADCDDEDGTIYPGAVEVCGDTVDQDCSGDPDDGETDFDGDGHVNPACTDGDDCDDHDDDVYPGAPEDCDDHEDLDCDGVAGDEHDSCCSLVCSCDWGEPQIGLTCGTGSLSCSYDYNSLGQLSSADCTYSNGYGFSCSFGYPDSSVYYNCSSSIDESCSGTC